MAVLDLIEAILKASLMHFEYKQDAPHLDMNLYTVVCDLEASPNMSTYQRASTIRTMFKLDQDEMGVDI
jgi:hypothetical protein